MDQSIQLRRSRRDVVRALGGLGSGALGAIAGCMGDTPEGPETIEDTTTTRGNSPETTTGTTDGESNGSNDPPSFARWHHETPHDALGTLTLAPGMDGPAVYVGSRQHAAASNGHALHAISLPDGTEQWQLQLSHAVRTTPMYGGDDGPERLYFATGPESLHGRAVEFQAVNPVRGTLDWTFDSADRRFLYPLAATDDAVFVGRRDDQIGERGEFLYGLVAADGRERWRIDSGDARTDGHAVRRDTALLVTRNRLHAVDPASGEERWLIEANRGIDGPAYDNRAERVFLGDDGIVRALSVENGRERWRREFGFTISSVVSPRAALADTVFVGDYDGRLLALSPVDGETRWTLTVDEDQFYPSVERTSERLLVGGAGVHAVDPVSGEREWSFGTDHRGSIGVSVGRTVFAKDGVSNRLYALDPATGDERWRFAPDRRIIGLETPGHLAIVGVGGTVYALDGRQAA